LKPLTVVAVIAIGLSSCGKQSSAVTPPADGGPSASAAGSGSGYGPSSASYQTSEGATEARDKPVPMVDGKPMWAANRRHTAEENAQYQFTKNGADFGARSESDYVEKAHAFVDRPPAGVQSLDRRNGDKLLYDPKANIFAVVSRDGAPRTMFKPRTGAAYWAEQKAREGGGGGATPNQAEG